LCLGAVPLWSRLSRLRTSSRLHRLYGRPFRVPAPTRRAVFDYFRTLFQGFTPHGDDYLWAPDVLWPNVIADALLAAACFSIAFVFVFSSRRLGSKPHGLLLFFASFIALCGLLHVIEVVNVWTGAYRFAGFAKLATAAVAVGTAITLWPALKQALALPHPVELQEANAHLQQEIQERKRVETELAIYKAQLEDQVMERTARLEAETERREAAERNGQELADIVRSSDDAITITDLDGNIVYWNRGAELVYGYPAEDILGQSIDLLAADAGDTETDQIIGRIKAGETIPNLETQRKRKDGSLIDISLSAFPIAGGDGSPGRFAAISRDISAQKKLTDRVDFLADIVLKIDDAVIRASSTHEGRITYWNAGAERLFGYSSEEAIGKLPIDFIPDELIETATEHGMRAVSGESVTYDTYRYHRNGTRFEARVSLFPIFDDSGNVRDVAAIVSDITSRTEAERFRDRLAEAMPAILYVFDLAEQRNVYVNRQIADSMGYTPEDYKAFGDNILAALLHPDDIENIQAYFEAFREHPTDEVKTLQYRCIAKDGSVRWFSSSDQLLDLDPDGKGRRVIGVVEDITEQRESERFIERLAETMPAILYVFDLVEQRNVYANKELFSVLGYSAEDVQAMGDQMMGMIMHPDDQERIGAHWGQLLETADEETLSIEYRCRHADGSYRWLVSYEKVLNRQPNGQARQIIGIVEDVTERRQSEENIQRYLQELEDTNKELDEFAYVASHDLRAPLRAISNLASWIEEDAHEVLPEDSKSDLQLLRKRAARMERLLNDLLQYSRAGRKQGAETTFSAHGVALDVAGMIDPPEGLSLSVRLADEPDPMLTSFMTPLEQVLLNLVTNAIKHHDQPSKGHVDLLIEDAGEAVRFIVSDNGPGIPEQYHTQVFGMFETLKARDEVEASGMGLAIVKKIVEKNGGSITLDSPTSSGRGATFVVMWPKTV
ncbi:MAG: PAS domain S-box protein, partial [Bacteroidota bacterium]